ncbi:MAG TPA: DUF6785 family protein [Polyangiaceae bacterium]
MTPRGLILGLCAGLAIASLTYFNDWVMGQTVLIGTHLPISVFGGAIFVLFFVNPLLRRIGPSWPLTRAEVVVMVAIALSACGWPGANFYRKLAPVTALPAHWIKTAPNWQANAVMSYVPGASPELGQGHVRDWSELAKTVQSAGGSTKPSPGRQIWLNLSDEGRRIFSEAAGAPRVELGKIPDLTRRMNEALRRPTVYDAVAFKEVKLSEPLRSSLRGKPSPEEIALRNRYLLVAAFPGNVLPPPPGRGALLEGARAESFAVETLLTGRSRGHYLGLGSLPWQAWWPTLRIWCVAAFLLGACSLCLALVVHPQWSRRELLAYPVVRFLEESSELKPGKYLPEVARDNFFWLGFGLLVFWHLLGGLHAWFPPVPEIPRRFDFGGLYPLFPNMTRVDGWWGWLYPSIYLSVIAFAFFMPTSISFSLGMSQVLFFVLGSALIANGIHLEHDDLGTKSSDLLQFGSYFGFLLIIAYTGRRYYANLLWSAVGRPRAPDTPAYAMWACRLLVLCAGLVVVTLRLAGLGWLWSLLLVLLALLIFLIITRIVAETGAFWIQTAFVPAGVLIGLLGFDAIGPTPFILLGLASTVLVLDTREIVMPFLTNGIRMTDREDIASPGRIAPWILAMLTISFVVAGAVTLYLQHNRGLAGDKWAFESLPRFSFDPFARFLSEASAQGTLSRTTFETGIERLRHIHPSAGALPWTMLGVTLVLVASAARLRLPWWPLHPVAFLVWNTYAIVMFGPSFLLGWAIKAGVVRTTGARGYHAVKPFMVGVIAGELLSGLLWMMIGAAYYFSTGKSPASYAIFPS